MYTYVVMPTICLHAHGCGCMFMQACMLEYTGSSTRYRSELTLEDAVWISVL